MSAPTPRVVPHIWELQALIVDMMHYDVDAADYDPDELDEYTELLYGAIRGAKQQFIAELLYGAKQ